MSNVDVPSANANASATPVRACSTESRRLKRGWNPCGPRRNNWTHSAEVWMCVVGRNCTRVWALLRLDKCEDVRVYEYKTQQTNNVHGILPK